MRSKYLTLIALMLLSCSKDKSVEDQKFIKDFGEPELTQKEIFFNKLALSNALESLKLKKKKRKPVDITYIKEHLEEFRGKDKNQNTLDDEKIEKVLRSWHPDPYVQEALIGQAVLWQAIIENPDDLESVKKLFVKTLDPQNCASYLYPNDEKRINKLNFSVQGVVLFNETRDSLWAIADKTLHGEFLEYGTSFRDEKGNISKNRIDMWNECPFKFKPGDKEKYHKKWLDYDYEQRKKRDWRLRYLEEQENAKK